MKLGGKLLDVNLTDGRINILNISEKLTRKFIGGLGINVWFLHKNVNKNVDPLAPENVLLLSCGLLTGMGAPASSRVHLNSKSPLTGLMASSNLGGKFGKKLRINGFQSILIRGRAQKPVYIWIRNGVPGISNASSIWGLETFETENFLKANLGDKTLETIAIGPGGENLVLFASVVHDRDHVAGRSGLGAVMGSKNLKAIVVQAQKRKIKIDPSAASVFKKYVQQIMGSPSYKNISKYGISSFVKSANEAGYLATRNFRNVQFEDADKIDGRKLYEYVTRLKSCYKCPVHCKADTKIVGGKFSGDGCRPEYESAMSLGSKCGMNNPEALIHLNTLCNRLGVDTISTGSVIAFAIDLYDRGIVTIKDTGGMELGWGNVDAMEELIYQTVRREGFGDILAQGVRKASQKIGRGSEKFAYHIKGLEMPGIDPRGAMGTALGYAVSMRGADWSSVYPAPEYHWSPERAQEELGNNQAANRFSTEGKGSLIKRTMCASAALDSLGICKFPALSLIEEYNLKNEAELTAALTGWDVDSDNLLRAGERILNFQRLFNLMHGANSADDKLPDKFLEDGADQGPAKGKTVDLKPMLRDFYRTMGWDNEGVPTDQNWFKDLM